MKIHENWWNFQKKLWKFMKFRLVPFGAYIYTKNQRFLLIILGISSISIQHNKILSNFNPNPKSTPRQFQWPYPHQHGFGNVVWRSHWKKTIRKAMVKNFARGFPYLGCMGWAQVHRLGGSGRFRTTSPKCFDSTLCPDLTLLSDWPSPLTNRYKYVLKFSSCIYIFVKFDICFWIFGYTPGR